MSRRGPLRDTIAAVSTPPGRGGIGIVRVSGAGASEVARRVIGAIPEPRFATYAPFRDASGNAIDHGVALFWPGPGSYTGEDVLELQGHGGAVVLDLILTAALEAGARIARPGEFTERAFLNDKLDLAQAEAVADLIEAGSEAAARGALRSLEGDFSHRVHALTGALVALRTHIEAAIDFPEEEIDFLADTRVAAQLHELDARITELLAAAAQGAVLREGVHVVIAGRPNVGKSSVLNRLAGHDRAIVTETPGTTRDLLREHIHLDGLPLHVVDTAGIRDAGDEVERIGIERALTAVADADALLLLCDDREGLGRSEEAIVSRARDAVRVVLVRNKIDLTGSAPGLRSTNRAASRRRGGQATIEVAISAKHGDGFTALTDALKQIVGYVEPEGGGFLARRRHLEALRKTSAAVHTAIARLEGERAGELVAEELRQAQLALGEITGEFTSEDLLGRIFSSFCIGK